MDEQALNDRQDNLYNEYMSPSGTICKKSGDPYIYLRVNNEWYCYDPAQPPLGGGAMGTVYLGYRVSNGARIAVKRINDAYASQPQIRERARMEASLAFRHPNMIEILGYCQWEEAKGPFFILSNYVQGEGIKSFVRNIPGDSDRVKNIVQLVLPMLDSLDYIHSRGIVHRDIKPSNIMVEEGHNVRLMDLGIARPNGGNKFSSFGFIGTPQYAAPEQILREHNKKTGQHTEINASTDIYATGITIYELLTGNNPFNLPIEDQVLASQISTPLPTSPMIPSRLMQVLHKATAKKQAERYQSAAEFKAALEHALDPEASSLEKAMAWIKYNWGIVVGGVVGLIALIVALIILI